MKPRLLVMTQSTAFGGMEQRSISQDLPVVQQLGWAPVVVMKLWPALRRWADDLRQSGIEVVDYAPPQFLTTWDRWRVRRVKKVLGRRGFSRLIARHQPGGLLCYASSLTDCLAHLSYGSRYNMPRVLSVHSTYEPHQWDPWQRRLLKQAFAGLAGLRCLSYDCAAAFLRPYGDLLPAGVSPTVIYNGADLERFRPPTVEERAEARRNLGIDAGAVVLGTVSRLHRLKGVVPLLETFIRLHRVRPELRLVVAGEGPQREELIAAIRAAGVADKVRLLGHVQDVRSVLWGLDLFALFSYDEGLGNSTIEAMGAGLPVIATNVSGTREVVRHEETGVLFPYGEWERASEAVDALLAAPGRTKVLAAAARRRAELVFDVRQRQEKVAGYFRQAFGSYASRTGQNS